jgi:hypothetical protein
MFTRAICTVDFTFEQDNFDDDAKGDRDADAKKFAKGLLKKYKRPHMDDLTSMVMALEQKASEAVAKKAKVRQINGGSYDGGDVLSVPYSVESVADVQRLRDVFDSEGRSYDEAPYITASGMILWLDGYNGKAYGLSSSVRNDSDLDEWLEANTPKKRVARKPKKSRR